MFECIVHVICIIKLILRHLMKSHCFGNLLKLIMSIVNPLVTETSIVDSMFTEFLSLTLCKEGNILNASACG